MLRPAQLAFPHASSPVFSPSNSLLPLIKQALKTSISYPLAAAAARGLNKWKQGHAGVRHSDRLVDWLVVVVLGGRGIVRTWVMLVLSIPAAYLPQWLGERE